MTGISDANTLRAEVAGAVAETTVTDMHTHLFPPAHDGLLLWGIDEMLRYHYLVAETLSAATDITAEQFYAMPADKQAEFVWDRWFIRRPPISEAARGVITTLQALGLDGDQRDLNELRAWFAQWKIEDYLPHVLKTANIDYVVMTNNPFEAAEVDCWDRGLECPDYMKTALRIDPLLLNWPAAAKVMNAAGYNTGDRPDAAGFAEARRFLADWAEKLRPVYMAASLPSAFTYPDDSTATAVLDEVVMPAAEELDLPMGVMTGTRRAINPSFRLAGDGVGVADVGALANLCAKYPRVKFLATMLSRDNQHELCVTSQKFANLHLFGCWWYCNTMSIIEELTRMRVELLGSAFTAQHSDARVLDQVIYKWSHTRDVVAEVLCDKYENLYSSGRTITTEEIRRDVRSIFGGQFEQFVGE